MTVASATDIEPLPFRSLFRYAVVSTAVSVHYYDYRKPVRNRGAGIFLHVDGRGATAGCVSVPAGAGFVGVYG